MKRKEAEEFMGVLMRVIDNKMRWFEAEEGSKDERIFKQEVDELVEDLIKKLVRDDQRSN